MDERSNLTSMGMKSRYNLVGLTFADFAIQSRKLLESLPYYQADDKPIEQLGMLHVGSDIKLLFAEQLQGRAPSWRHMALHYFASQAKTPTTERTKSKSIKEPRVCTGDLHVSGNLENESVLVVLGDLIVDGNYLAFLDYPVLYVGGDMHVKHMFAQESETICLHSIQATDSVVLSRNHTVTIAECIQTPTLIQSDASIDAKMQAKQCYQDSDYGVFKETFGLKFNEDAEDFDADEHVIDGLLAQLRS